MGDEYHASNGRREQNIRSKAWASRDGEAWNSVDDEIILQFWINFPAVARDEISVSQVLQRTIESCRVRAEKIRENLGINSPRPTKVITITETRTTYIGVYDDPDDRWWEGPTNAQA